jgi:uncharacterized protein (DUF885 family)
MTARTRDQRSAPEAPGLRQLAESYFDLRWHFDPVEGSAAGSPACDGRLGSFSDESVRLHLAALRSLGSAAEELALDGLEDEIDRTALLYDIRVSEHRFRRERPHRRDPGLWIGHALEALHQLLIFRDRAPAALARAAYARLTQVPAFLSQATSTLHGCPRVLIETAIDVCRAGPALVEDLVRAHGVGMPEEARQAAAEAQAALAAFGAHLESALRTAPSEGWAIGREAFDFRLQFQHALRAGEEELLRYGLRLTDEVERDLDGLARDLGGGQWPDVMERLRGDYPPRGGLLEAYRDVMERARAHVAARDLMPLPVGSLVVEETPSHIRPLIPLAAYLPPGAVSTERTGRFFVTVPPEGDPRLRDHCRHEIPATAVHEAYPGHHLHLLAARAHPRIVRRVLTFPIAVEGWALYGEELMEEEGFYPSAEARFFRRVALLRRALRIPLDIGLHTSTLDYDAAVRFVTERMQVSRERAEAEVRRTCADPGYQLAYAVGRRELLALRERWRQSAGAGAGSRAFHAAVLGYGGLPPSLVSWGLGLDG